MGKHFILALFISLLLTPGAQAANQHYSYDDGTAEDGQGGFTGDIVWLQYFDPLGASEMITHVATSFGSPLSSADEPSSNVVHVYVWDDPNNDGDPADAVLLGTGQGYLREYNSDVLTHYALDEPVTVISRFFVGVKVSTDTICWPRPLDESQESNGRAWFVGDSAGNFNPNDLTDNDHTLREMTAYGLHGLWMLRACRLSPDVDGHSFDWTTDKSDFPGWTEQNGGWEIFGRQLASEALASNQVITRHLVPQADGCLEVKGLYGDGVGLRYAGALVRYISDTDRILVKLQDNGDNGYFDTCYVYEDTTIIFSEYGQNYGADPTLQVSFMGTQLQVRIDVDGDGVWEHEYPVTVTTTQEGYVGLAAYNRCLFDDWHCGPSADAWGGEIIGFDDVPEDYWHFGGGQSLGAYYHGQNFYYGVTVFEATVYGYQENAYPHHSADAVIASPYENEYTVYFSEPKTHVGFWYTSMGRDGIARAYDSGGTLLDSEILLSNTGCNGYVSLDAAGIKRVEFWHPVAGCIALDDLEFQPPDVMENTVDSVFSCSPLSGTLPFAVNMTVELTNAHEAENRRIAARINVRLANNATYSNWRTGYTNLRPGASYVASWQQSFPALGALVGTNNFTLSALDVTPAPYNQPPYAPAGDIEVKACMIDAYAP